jgi:hypothetical protein
VPHDVGIALGDIRRGATKAEYWANNARLRAEKSTISDDIKRQIVQDMEKVARLASEILDIERKYR